MATKTKAEVATTSSNEVAEVSDEEAALIAANQQDVDASEFVVPIIKLAQPLTDEVTEGNAKAGDFILSLTGDAISPPFNFVVSGKGKGRFRPGRNGERTLVSYEDALVPWTNDPFFGKPFAEHPDAEESYSKRVNDGDIEWGSGPPIQTTYNYTGYVIPEDENSNVAGIPVRLSLRRTSAPAAKKWNTLLDAVLRGRYWDSVFEVGSEQKKNDQGAFYVVTVRQGRKTTADEKKDAIQLATALRNQAVTAVGDEDATVAAPAQDDSALDL